MPFGLPYAGDGSRITDLILRAGDIRARGAAERGDILGQTISGLGQLAGQTFERAQEQQAAKERDARVFELMSNPDATLADYVRTAGPKEGSALFQGVIAARKMEQGDPEEARKLLPYVLKTWKSLKTPEARAAAFPHLRGLTVKSGLFPDDPSVVPPEYNEETGSQIEEAADGILQAFGEQPDLELVTYTDSEGRKVQEWVVPEAGRRFVSEPQAEEPKAGTFEAYLTSRYGPRPTPEQQLAAKREFEAAGRAPQAPSKPEIITVDNRPYRMNDDGTLSPVTLAGGEPLPTKEPEGPKPLSGDASTKLAYSTTAIKNAEDLEKLFTDTLGGRVRYQAGYLGLDTNLKRKVEDLIQTSVYARSGAQAGPKEVAERVGQIWQLIDFASGGNPNAAREAIGRIKDEMRDLQTSLDPTGEYRKRAAAAREAEDWVQVGNVRVRKKP